MKSLVISVITVVYNDVTHIEQTMLSVFNQSYPHIEYIVIDGGSTDGTVDVIRKYADRLAFWVSEPDGGIYPAMNKGLEHATGEWVNFMNSGDTFADEHVLENVFGRNQWSDKIKIIGGHTNRVYADHVELFRYWDPFATPHFMPFGHQASFTRRIIDGNKPFQFILKYRIASDYAIMYDVFWKYGGEAFGVVDRAIANYSMEGSPSFVNAKKTKKEFLSIQSKHIDLLWIKEVVKWLFM